jgi:hypothetical protein
VTTASAGATEYWRSYKTGRKGLRSGSVGALLRHCPHEPVVPEIRRPLDALERDLSRDGVENPHADVGKIRHQKDDEGRRARIDGAQESDGLVGLEDELQVRDVRRRYPDVHLHEVLRHRVAFPTALQ